MTYPYSDNFMIFDEESKRYVLTNEYVRQRLGIDLLNGANERDFANAEIAVKHFLEEVEKNRICLSACTLRSCMCAAKREQKTIFCLKQR